MVRLRNGPVEGTYMVQRAPLFLRAVKSTGKHKDKDVLDQLDDLPHTYERVYVYRRIGEAHTVHLNMGSRRKGTGFYASAEYEHLADVDGEALRETAAWQEWVHAREEAQS